MRRRIVSLLLALCMGFTLLPGRAAAADTVEYPVEGGVLYFDKSTGTITNADNKTITSAVIPESIEGVPVTALRSYTFQGNTSLKSVTINAKLTEIERSSFDNCSALESVKLPESMTKIGNQAFIGCTSLTDINLPNAITEIGGQAFRGCASLRSVTLPTGMTSTGAGFEFCTGLEEITIPSSVTTISGDAFDKCTALKTVHLPDTLTRIENRAFAYCSSLAEISIPDSVTSIGAAAFIGCSSLESFRFPNTVTVIENQTLSGCSALKYVIIPKTVTEIGLRAFDNCNALSDIYVGHSKAEWEANVNILKTGNDVLKGYFAQYHYESGGSGGGEPVPPEPDRPDHENDMCIVKMRNEYVSTDKNGYVHFRIIADFASKAGALLLDDLTGTLDIGTDQRFDGSATSGPVDLGPYDETSFSWDLYIPSAAASGMTVHRCRVRFSYVFEEERIEIYNELYTYEINHVKRYTVTFDLNGGRGNVPQSVEVFEGDKVSCPPNPTRSGYTFFKWYSGGKPWKFNTPVRSDVELSAYWQNNKLRFGTETYQFENTDTAFFSSGDPRNYSMREDYFNILTGNIPRNAWDYITEALSGWCPLTKSQKEKIQGVKDTAWCGSCFGMSVVAALHKKGDLHASFFQKGASSINDLSSPHSDDTVRSLIQYYHLLQVINEIEGTHKLRVPSNNKKLIENVKSSKYPVVFSTIFRSKNGMNAGQHTMLAYDWYDDGSDCCLKVWDPNCTCMLEDDNKNNILRMAYDGSSASFENFHENTYFSTYDTYIESSFTLESGILDRFNLEKSLRALGYSRGWETAPNPASEVASFSLEDTEVSAEDEGVDITDYTLYTNYSTFTVSRSDGVEARIEGGVKVSGALDIPMISCLNEPGYPTRLAVSLPILGSEESYTVTPQETDPAGQYSTNLMSYGDGADGFYANVDSAFAGAVTFYKDGTTATAFDSPVEHTVKVVRDDITTPWYCVSANTQSNGITVTPDSSGMNISSVGDSTIDITAKNEFNEIQFQPVSVSGESAIRLEEGDGANTGTTVLVKDETVLESKALGHSVTFFTLQGTEIPGMANIPYGSVISRPADPVCKGCQFEGWYLDPGYEEAWSFETPVTEDIGLFAKWTPVSFSPEDYAVSRWTVSGGTTRVEFTDPMVLWQEDISLLAAEYAPSGKLLRVVEGILTGDLEHGNGAAAFPAALSENSAVFFLGAGKVPLGPKVLLTNEKRQ